MAAITGLDPSILADPNYQVEMMRAQRQMALAQALRQQSLTDTPGNGGSVSWTQGLARLAEALSSSMNERQAEKNMTGANQGYAAGLARMFGVPLQTAAPPMPQGAPPSPQMGQGTPPAPSGSPMPQMPPQAPQGAPVDPLAPLPVAPPQAAPPQPPASSPAPAGGAARGPWALTGNPQQDFALYMSNPEEYSKAMIGNAAKGGAPLDTETIVAHARDAMSRGDIATATALLGSLEKQNYIAPTAARPGGWTQDPHTGQWMFHPQAPIPGAVPGPMDANGNMTWQVPAGTEAAIAQRAQSQSAGESAGKAPYQLNQVYNKETGQMEYVPTSTIVGSGAPGAPSGSGGGSLNQHYGVGASPSTTPTTAPAGHYAAGPPIGRQAAADAYGKGSAQAFLNDQDMASTVPQQTQSLREMEGLIKSGLTTGPTAAKQQEWSEHFGLTPLASNKMFLYNKDANRFAAQAANALGLSGSDARVALILNASPNSKMTPSSALSAIHMTIGLGYGLAAKAAAGSAWAQQRGPDTNAQFQTWWRQNYDPSMFTAYAAGGPQALRQAPANLRQQWLKDYRNLKGMGVDFAQFAQ